MQDKSLVFITFVVILTCFIIIFAGVRWFHQRVYKKQETMYIEIYTVDLNNNCHGSFMLGSGYINETMYYYVYQATEDGGKELKKYDSDDVTIYETLKSSEQPYIEILKEDALTTHIKMYLPENSIIEEYHVNLPN